MLDVRHLGVALAFFLRPALAAAERTEPLAGAASLPSDFDLHWPLSAGEEVTVTSGYGPSGGSTLHDGLRRSCCANDYYALDLVLRSYPQGGRGRAVLAAQSGIVVRAGWATGGWSGYGQRVILVHDYDADGHSYTSTYAHLDSVEVEEGQHVLSGERIGAIGGSSRGNVEGVGFHLHWVLHQDSDVGGSGTGGSRGGRAVVPEPIDGAESIRAGRVLLASTAPLPAPCTLSPDAPTIIDEQSECFQRHGPVRQWHRAVEGEGGSSLWTYAIDAAAPSVWGTWRFLARQPGAVELWAAVPAALAGSEQTRYVVRHAARDDIIEVSQQSTVDGWLPLGAFAVDGDSDEFLSLADNTGEPYRGPGEASSVVVFDALRVVYSDGDPDAAETNGSDIPADRSRTTPLKVEHATCSIAKVREGWFAFAVMLGVAIRVGCRRP